MQIVHKWGASAANGVLRNACYDNDINASSSMDTVQVMVQ